MVTRTRARVPLSLACDEPAIGAAAVRGDRVYRNPARDISWREKLFYVKDERRGRPPHDRSTEPMLPLFVR